MPKYLITFVKTAAANSEDIYCFRLVVEAEDVDTAQKIADEITPVVEDRESKQADIDWWKNRSGNEDGPQGFVINAYVVPLADLEARLPELRREAAKLRAEREA